MYIVTIKDYPNGHGKPKRFRSKVQVFHWLRKILCAWFSDRENYTSWKKLVLTENNFSWYGFEINIKERAND